MSKSVASYTVLLDIAYRDGLKAWGGSRVGWFKPTLSAQIARDATGQVMILGQPLAVAKAQVAAYQTAQKRAAAAGFLSRLSFKVKSWFSSTPRIQAVVNYYEAHQQYQAVSASLAEASLDKQNIPAAVTDYVNASTAVRAQIPTRFLTQKQRSHINRLLGLLERTQLQEREPVDTTAEANTGDEDVFLTCTTIPALNRRYASLQFTYAQTLIEEITAVYTDETIAAQDKYAAESNYIQRYRAAIVQLKRQYQLHAGQRPPSSIRHLFLSERESISGLSSLSECKTQALGYYLLQQKLAAYDVLLDSKLADDEKATALKTIAHSLDSTYQLFAGHLIDKQTRRVTVANAVIRSTYIKASGVVDYLTQVQSRLATHRTGLAAIINSVKTDFQRMSFKHADDFERFKHLMAQRVDNYQATFSRVMQTHPRLIGLQRFFSNNARGHAADRMLLNGIKREGLRLAERVNEQISERIFIPMLDAFTAEVGPIYKKHEKILIAHQQDETNLEAARNRVVSQYSHRLGINDDNHGLNTSTAYICKGVICTTSFSEAEDNIPKEDLAILKENERALIRLWIDTFQTYAAHLKQLKSVIERVISQAKPDVLELLETNTDYGHRDAYIQRLLHQIGLQYLKVCEDSDIANRLEGLNQRWREVKRLHPDSNKDTNEDLQKLTDIYFAYFVSRPTDVELEKYHGRYYWERLNQLRELLTSGREAYENTRTEAFSSVPRLHEENMLALLLSQVKARQVRAQGSERADSAEQAQAPSCSAALVPGSHSMLQHNFGIIPDIEEAIVTALYEPTAFSQMQRHLDTTRKELKEVLKDVNTLRSLRICLKERDQEREEKERERARADRAEQGQEEERREKERERQEKERERQEKERERARADRAEQEKEEERARAEKALKEGEIEKQKSQVEKQRSEAYIKFVLENNRLTPEDRAGIDAQYPLPEEAMPQVLEADEAQPALQAPTAAEQAARYGMFGQRAADAQPIASVNQSHRIQ